MHIELGAGQPRGEQRELFLRAGLHESRDQEFEVDHAMASPEVSSNRESAIGLVLEQFANGGIVARFRIWASEPGNQSSVSRSVQRDECAGSAEWVTISRRIHGWKVTDRHNLRVKWPPQ